MISRRKAWFLVGLATALCSVGGELIRRNYLWGTIPAAFGICLFIPPLIEFWEWL